MSTEPAEKKKPGVLQWLGWALSASGFIAFFTLLLAPAASNRMQEWTTRVQTVPAHVQSCDLARNGTLHQDEVRCTFTYAYKGTLHVATSPAWATEGPFVTSSGLARELAAQSRNTERTAHVHSYSAAHAMLIDRRRFTMPPLWLLLTLVFVGCLILCFALVQDVHRRSDMVYQHDDALGRNVLVEAPGITTRGGARRAMQAVALLCAAIICIYCLTNRPSNRVQRFFLQLQPTPARLVDCEHRWSGTSKGHDQIRCDVQYTFHATNYTGSAEAVDFRMFPTNARMNAEVSRVVSAPQRVAYVDPQHPTFAIAYVDNRWIAPYSLGIFECLVVVILFVLLPILFVEMVRTPR